MSQGFGKKHKSNRAKKIRLYQCDAIPEKLPSFVSKETAICHCCNAITFEVDLNHEDLIPYRGRGTHVSKILQDLGFINADYFDNMSLEEFVYLGKLYKQKMSSPFN